MKITISAISIGRPREDPPYISIEGDNVEDYQRQMYSLIENTTGQANILTIPVMYINYTGSIEAALLLSQLCYWTSRTQNSEGWIYKTNKEWQEEIHLKEYSIRKATKVLVDMDIIEVQIKRANGSPTLHYRIKQVEFLNSILRFLKNETLNSQKPTCENTKTLTDTTTETTPKTTTNIYTSESPEYTDEFETFWKAYPRHKEKFKAYKTWKARLKEKADPQQLITAAQNYTAYCKDSKTEEQFIKHPSTFLGPDKPYTEYINYKPTGAIPKNLAKALELVKKAEQEEQEGYKGGSVFD
jgi:hypothetical protein